MCKHDYAQEQTWFEREMEIYTAANHQPGIATALRGLGFVAVVRGELAQAQHYTGRSLTVSRAVADRWGAAWSLFDLGYLALVRGEADQARVLLEEALSELRAQGNLYGTLRALIALGNTMRRLGDHEQAREYYRYALRIQQRTHYVGLASDGLEALAGIAAAAGDPLRAARLFGAAHAHREAVGGLRWRHMNAIYERDVALARSLLDQDGWHAAWAAGGAMPLDKAVAYALAEQALLPHDNDTLLTKCVRVQT